MPRLLNSSSLDEVGGCIEGRVQMKGPLHSWKKLGKEGQVFNFVIVDNTGTIQVPTTGDVSDLYERIKIDKCLRSACSELKASNSQFDTSGPSYEVHLTKVSSLRPTSPSNQFIPFLTDNPFVCITRLLQLSKVEEIEGEHLPKDVVEYVTLAELEDVPLGSRQCHRHQLRTRTCWF